MTKEGLCQFLTEVNNNVGYASGNQSAWIKEPDGSTTIPYESGLWKFHDNFFGGEPFGGRTVVSFKGTPAWIMVYYGAVEPSADNILEIYAFLQKALSNPPKDLPIRGPKVFTQGDFEYRNKLQGGVERYSGKENIYQKGIGVYSAEYRGGWINQRQEQ